MRDKKLPLLVGLLLLVVIGFVIGLVLMQDTGSGPQPRANKLIADNDTERDDTPANTDNTQPREPEVDETPPAPVRVGGDKPVVAPKVLVFTATSVSGIAIDSFDDPAEGATVTLLRLDDNASTGPTAVTDADGKFLFIDVQVAIGEAHVVACLMEGKALSATELFTVQADKPTEGLSLRIYDQARAYGEVLNGADSTPLEGVSIEVDGRSALEQRLGKLLGRVKPVVSDSQGRFEVTALAPGNYLMRAVKKGWTASEINPMTRAVQQCELGEYANFELLPFILLEAGIVEGRVIRKADRAPLVGATVELGSLFGGALANTTTDEEGKFLFDTVPPGIAPPGNEGDAMGGLMLRAFAPGYAVGQRNVRVRSGQRREITIEMDAGCTVTGKVINNKSEPVAGASVYFNDNDFQRGGEMIAGVRTPPRAVSTVTDENGNFSLGGVPAGPQGITASAEGYANTTSQVTLDPSTPATVTITLQPAAEIFGQVMDQNGYPVPDVPVAAYDASGPAMLGTVMKAFFAETLPDRGEGGFVQASVKTDAEGRYRLTGLKEGKFVLLANARAYQKYVSPELELKAGQQLEHNFALPTGGTVYGRVYDASNRPLSGVPVTAVTPLGTDPATIRTIYTDRMGNYEISGLTPGTYTVTRLDGDFARLLLPNPSKQIAIKAGERVQFDIYDQQPGTARIYGRATVDGQAYADKDLVLIGGSRGGFAFNNAKTDASGNYEFRSVPLGTYQIAQSGGRMPSLVRVRLRVDKEGDMEFNVDFVTVTIGGRVEVEGGKLPEGRVRVLASPVNPDGTDRAESEEDINELEMMVFSEGEYDDKTGNFTVKGLSPGFYRLSARSEKNGMISRPYMNVRASVGGIVLTLPAQGASLKGTVTGLDDAKGIGGFGLIAALTIEDDKGQPLSLGGFDNGINLTQSKEFTVENLPEGTFTITLSVTGYTPVTYNKVKFTNGQTVSLAFAFATAGAAKIIVGNADINVATAMELQYDIVNSKGEAFKKRFTFLDFFDQSGNVTQSSGQNAFVIKDMPAETYTITMTLPGYKPATATFTVVAGQTVDVPVQFEQE